MNTFHGKSMRLWQLLVAAMLIASWVLGFGTTSAYASKQQVPFSASYSGAISFASNGVWLLNGTGIATHMGRSTNAGYLVFTAVPVDCAGGVPSDNHETLTAANGDMLAIVSHDVACPIGPNLYQGSGNWEVLGGTGRFTGATGRGHSSGTPTSIRKSLGFNGLALFPLLKLRQNVPKVSVQNPIQQFKPSGRCLTSINEVKKKRVANPPATHFVFGYFTVRTSRRSPCMILFGSSNLRDVA